MIVLIAMLAFPALMIFAALNDLFTMTIPNKISVALVAIFLVLSPLAGFSLAQIGSHFSCSAVVLAMTFALFSFGVIGGGDAKLAAATSLWLGWANVLDYGLLASIIGGALTLGILSLRSMPLPGFLLKVEWATRLHDKNEGVPYGIALAAAALLIYPYTGIWLKSIA